MSVLFEVFLILAYVPDQLLRTCNNCECYVNISFTGKDATSAFHGTGVDPVSAIFGRKHSDRAQEWLKEFEIGELGN